MADDNVKMEFSIEKKTIFHTSVTINVHQFSFHNSNSKFESVVKRVHVL